MPTYKQLSRIPRWIKIRKTFEDFAVAGFTNDIEIYTLPVRGVIHASQIVPVTDFSGGTIATYTISLGVAGDLTKASTPKNVFTGAPDTPAIGAGGGLYSISGDTTIRAAAISTVGNLDAATTGVVDIYLLVSQLPE